MGINYSIGRRGPCNLLRVRSHRKKASAAPTPLSLVAPQKIFCVRLSALANYCGSSGIKSSEWEKSAARLNGRRRAEKNRRLASSQKTCARAWEKRRQLNRCILLISTRPVSYSNRRWEIFARVFGRIWNLNHFSGESWNLDGNFNFSLFFKGCARKHLLIQFPWQSAQGAWSVKFIYGEKKNAADQLQCSFNVVKNS